MLWRQKKRQIHFLHIGKNAGTQIKLLAKRINETSTGLKIVCHSHTVHLMHLEQGAEYFFSVRSPDSRFRSAFYSRKRKGQPRVFVEWTDQERAAFESFEHANDLAEALFEDSERGALAFRSIKAIRHTAMNQTDWFVRNGFFFEQRPPLAIIRQDRFDADMAFLAARLSVDLPRVSDDPISSHANDYSDIPPLSEKARANLRRWYAQDFEFYKHCAHWISVHQD